MQHNPVAIAIESLQQQWVEQTESVEGIKVARWLIKPEESALINGFLRLESSPHGQCDDFFVVLFTPYVSEQGAYSASIVKDMFKMWDEDQNVVERKLTWDRSKFRIHSQTAGAKNDKLLADVLNDFRVQFCQKGQRLILGLLPSTIEDTQNYNDWIVLMSGLLPEETALCLVDYLGTESYKSAAEMLIDECITLKCCRFDMQQMASDMIASQQDPESPQAVFQQCLLRMGKATNDKNTSSLKNWGAQAIKAAKLTGSQSFLATAYLVYAGFMMQLKNKETLELLHKGESLAQMAYHNKETEAATVLMQIYGYYSAYYSIMGHRRTACEWSLKQAEFAARNDMKIYAISMYRHTAQLAVKSESEICYKALADGYSVSESLSDDELKASEIRLIAYHYLRELYEANQSDGLEEDIDQRMSTIFGQEWQHDVPSLRDTHAQVDVNISN